MHKPEQPMVVAEMRGGADSRALAFGGTFALVLGAGFFLAPSAGAQKLGVSFACPKEECHIAPVTSAGGFVGKAADDAGVSFAITCGSHLTATEVTPDDNGGVTVLFSEENGLACHQDGTVEIRGLADGGWYWIVEYGLALPAPLIAKDTISNPSVIPWNPRSLNIDMHPLKNAYATVVFDAVTGSAGILPHLVSQPRTPTPPRCLPEKEKDGDWVQASTDCLLGDGGTAIAFRYGNTFKNPGAGSVTVTRPATGEWQVFASLWGNGSGHVSIADPVDPRHGHYLPGASAFAPVAWTMTVLDAAPGSTVGVTLSDSTITVSSDTQLCDPTSQPPADRTVRLKITAGVIDPTAIEVMPRVKVDRNFNAAERVLVVRCPAATANMGTDLLAGPAGPRRR